MPALFPFTAVVGQPQMRLALLLAAVDPAIGGVLIQGAKGTAKSTIVRSLAALLPSGRLRTLALGTTEDRLVGGLDLETTLTDGAPHFQPGLLAETDGGILYVDEVNLLDDHLVDLVLDAAASGVVTIEREGFSRTQPARFALVGTMNPEEGALRPQLLDRFGLCVEVTGAWDVDERVEIMTRRLAFDADPTGFAASWAAAETRLASRLRQARAAVPGVVLGRGLSKQIAELAMDAQTAGHRAELVMGRAARAHAAWCGRSGVTRQDVDAVAELVLAHRRRHIPPPPQVPAEPSPGRQGEATRQDETTRQGETTQPPPTDPAPPPSSEPHSEPSEPSEPPGPAGEPAPDQVAGVGELFRVRPLDLAASRPGRSGSGRRTTTVSDNARGRYIRSRPTPQPVDLALDATLRAGAVHQRSRRRRAAELGDPRRDLAVIIEPGDWRRKVRIRQAGSLVVLCVDASGSMGARGRMTASKGAVLSLLLDAYVKRDQVSLVSFRGTGAQVLVEPTSSIETAERRLRELPVGGRTPLAAGLVQVSELLRRALLRDPALRPLVIVVTDGRGNVDLEGRVSRAASAEAVQVAGQLARDDRVTWVIVDTEPAGPMARGHSVELAAALGARRFAIEELRADDLVSVVRDLQDSGNSRKERR